MNRAAHLILALGVGLAGQDGLYRVTRVIDGDTIEIDLNGRRERVRYIGIDTPETVHPNRGVEPYGLAASAANRRLVEGRKVRLELDVEKRDRYGRLLAYIWVEDILVNEWLVRNGYAQIATYPPNVRYVDRFLEAQREARASDRGLWGLGSEERGSPVRARTTATVAQRTGPDRSAPRMTMVPAGALLTVTRCRAGWCEVRYADRTGWIAQRHLLEPTVTQDTLPR